MDVTETETIDGHETLSVTGTIESPDSPAVDGLRIVIVDRNVAGDVPLTETVTDATGRFKAEIERRLLAERRKARPDLQAHVFSGETELGASAVSYNADGSQPLDVVLPARADGLPSEHETLVRAIARHHDGALRELQETDERPDISYLANKSGWDARAVALAVLADRFAAESEGQLDPALYYALFRAGLPADPAVVYRADPATVAGVWKDAIETGVVPRALGDRLDVATKAFQGLGAGHVLAARAFPDSSTVAELAHGALGDDAERTREFVGLAVRYRTDPKRLWATASRALGREAAERLQLDGRLAYLTLDNAPLIERLHEAEEGLTSLAELAERGYHRAERWDALLDGARIPQFIPGESDEERRARYAEMLAQQVRLAQPTAVVAALVRDGEVDLNVPADVRDGVLGFLGEHQGRFEIGMTPIDLYVARNDLEGSVSAPVRDQIRRLQRVYQITATDEALAAFFDEGLDSAYLVVEYDEGEFVETFAQRLGGEDAARLTYAKAEQVHATVLNVASSYLAERVSPALGSDPSAPVVGTASESFAMSAAVSASPTLEGLFGSMDYCSCEHCRSVLSPAAYLVDLLLFLDRPTNALENPQTVLLERRPDIAQLPLTCENTNTALPYIDLVNETLEYFVANNMTIAGYAGHDTGESASQEELLASPAYVDEAAYTALASASFPPPLPFHKSLEIVRRHLRRLDAPLPLVMERLRTSDAVERPNAASYGWRDILMERLWLSRAEHRLLTDDTVTLQELYGYSAATAEADVLAELRSVRTFTRRIGITAEQLADVLRTAYINPHGVLLPRLEALRVSLETLDDLIDGAITDAEFEAMLPPALDAADYGGDVPAWVRANAARITALITIAPAPGASDPCSVDALELRLSEPDPTGNSLTAFDYVRLARFIRLWRKLGWTIWETDVAIGALFAGDPTDPQDLDEGFLALLARLGAAVEVMQRLNLRRDRDLASMLAWWAPIGTAGPNALYRRLFLRPAVSAPDPAFDEDELGEVLQDPAATLLAHGETLRAALKVSGDELSAIASALAYDATTALTLETVSAVARRAWLARALRLSVRELLLLVRWTGLDPFAMPDPPAPAVLRLIELLAALRATALKPAEALYLFFNQDIGGRSAPPESDVTELARALRADAAAIDRDFALADDPSGELARARMTLVYGTEATDFFFGLLGETFTVTVPYAHPQATLAPAVVAAAGGRLSYDDLAKTLSFSGVLTPTLATDLQALPGTAAAFDAAIAALLAANQAGLAGFFDQYPELLPLYEAYAASTDPPEQRRSELLAELLPELVRRRKAQQAVILAAAAIGIDGQLARVLLDDATALHAAEDPSEAARMDLTAVEAHGLAARFFWAATATGQPDETRDTEPTLDYSPTGPQSLPENPTAGAPISGIWSGWLEPSETGLFNIAIEADPGATVTLEVSGADVPLTEVNAVRSNQSAVALTAGVLHRFVVTVENVTDRVAVRWETTGTGWDVIPGRLLYSDSLVARMGETYVRVLKAASLAEALGLSAVEVRHLATAPELRIGGEGWPNALVATGAPTAATAQALRDVIEALLAFVRIRDESLPDDDRLARLLEDPAATLPTGGGALEAQTGWDAESLAALLARLGLARSDLGTVENLRRVHDAYALVRRSGLSAAALIDVATNDPSPAEVAGLEAAVRARYEAGEVLEVIQQVNDELRDLRRDALVAHILHGLGQSPQTSHIDTPEKLFEFFLMDVEMEPCMLTSRVRHALSSVQLFAERCLMNLEPRVAASSIRAERWEWMKRYRVWEANRKVFLWPENWLEPELRDDKSSFFTEMMGELLQGDITEEAAATGLIRYLTKLEEVAQLEPSGMFLRENDPGAADDEVHVIARTAGARRTYYHRERSGGSWTPWNAMKLEIEDDPVLPVLWGNRLFAFWLRILTQSPVDPAGLPTTGSQTGLAGLSLQSVKQEAAGDAGKAKLVVEGILCWSEYVDGEWLPPKTSDPNLPVELGRFPQSGPGTFDRSSLRLGIVPDFFVLRIAIAGSGSGSFLLYNSHSAPVRGEDGPAFVWPLPIWPRSRAIYRDGPTLVASYTPSWMPGGITGPPVPFERRILEDSLPFRVVEPRQLLAEPWDAPFFFSDSNRAYWVSPTREVVTVGGGLGFGVVLSKGDLQLKAAPQVWLKRDVRKDGRPPLVQRAESRLPGFGVTDPVEIRQFVDTDRNIHTGFATAVPVRFDGVEVGPGGAIPVTG